MAASEDLIDSVANSNNKVEAGHPSFITILSTQNAVAHQNRLNILAETALAQQVKRLTEVDVLEAVATSKAAVGSEIPSLVANIMGAAVAAQQQAKTAQTTPPVTG